MAVLIKGMKMPESCSRCFVRPVCCPCCTLDGFEGETIQLINTCHPNCPLVEVVEVEEE